MTTAVEEMRHGLAGQGISDVNAIVGSVQLDPLTAVELSG